MSKKYGSNKWAENQKKAEHMTDKFIAVMEKVDGFHKWECIMMERIINKLINDSGLSCKPDYDGIMDTLRFNFGFTILKADSLAEQMKIEAFESDLKNNPYQLTLIA